MHRRLIAAVLCLAVVATPAAAAPTPEEEQEADRLFDEGRALQDAGRAAEACPYFERSQELDPGRGTLINLAACYEAVGRLVAALKVFRDVEAQSLAAGDQPRLDAARKRIAAIEARIPRLAITFSGPSPDDVDITIEGESIGRDAWADTPVDPGEIRVEATAPGYAPYRVTVRTLPDGKRATVEIPTLAPATSDGGGTVVIETSRRRNRPRMIAGIATLGVGALALGGSIVLALGAKGDYDDALADHCGGQPDGCDAEGVSLTGDARRRGNLATVIGGAGLLAVAGGLVLWLTAPIEETQIVPQVTSDGAGVSLLGRF